MSVKTIYRHTCDQCGKQTDEDQSNWLPCGGSDNWSAWNIKRLGTASCMYGTENASKEFCSFVCAIEYMQNMIEWDRLTK